MKDGDYADQSAFVLPMYIERTPPSFGCGSDVIAADSSLEFASGTGSTEVMAAKPVTNLSRMAKDIQMWLVDRLIPWARNPRTHSEAQVAQIAASIAEFGFNNPILVDTKAGIIAGHGRLLAARKLGLTEVPVIVLDHLSEAQKRAYVIADNKLAENAGWDDDLLRIEIEALQDESFDVSLLGFEDDELSRLLAAQDATEGLTDEDAVPELPETPTSRAGDLWILGEHKLLVGDSTNQSDVARLIAGEVADLVFTDPPYNVDYEGYTEEKLKIKGDRMSDADFKMFLEAAFRGLRAGVKPGASLYVCHSSSSQREFQNALGDCRWFRASGVRSSGRKIPSRGDLAGTNFATSRCSTVTWPARRTLGMATRRNRRWKRRSRRRTGFIQPRSRSN